MQGLVSRVDRQMFLSQAVTAWFRGAMRWRTYNGVILGHIYERRRFEKPDDALVHLTWWAKILRNSDKALDNNAMQSKYQNFLDQIRKLLMRQYNWQ